MKTATIRVNHIFGTKNQFCADVIYRGRILKSFYRKDLEEWESPNSLFRKAREWATCQGFTHYKSILG